MKTKILAENYLKWNANKLNKEKPFTQIKRAHNKTNIKYLIAFLKKGGKQLTLLCLNTMYNHNIDLKLLQLVNSTLRKINFIRIESFKIYTLINFDLILIAFILSILIR